MDLHTILEALALVFNLSYVLLVVFEKVLCWPAGLVGAVLTFAVFLDARLYGAMVLQAVYMGLMIYGWYKWRYGGEEGGQLAVTWTPLLWRVRLGIAGVVFAVALGLLLKYRTDAALPLWDAGTTSFSLVAQFMTTRKWIENWLVWIIVDVVYVGMLVSQQLYLMGALYFAYLILAALGFLKWQRSLATSPTGTEA